jgi:hypothetical protein
MCGTTHVSVNDIDIRGVFLGLVAGSHITVVARARVAS